MSAPTRPKHRMGRPASPETAAAQADAEAIREAYVKGEATTAIASRYGCNVTAIRTIVGAAESPSTRARKDRARMAGLRAAGASYAEIADEYGIGEETAARIILGARRPSRKRRTIAELRKLSTSVFAEAYERLGTYEAAAAEIGCTSAAVRRRLGLSKPYDKGLIPMREMVARYNAGESVNQLAQAAALPRVTVWRRLGYAGVEFRPQHVAAAPHAAPFHRSIQAVCLLYQAGAPSTVIGREFDVSDQTVRRVLRDQGVPILALRPTRDERERFGRLARAIRRGELVAESGRLVPRFVARDQGRAAPRAA